MPRKNPTAAVDDSLHSDRHPPLNQSRLLEQLGYHLRRADLLVSQGFLRNVSKPLKLTPVEYSVLCLLVSNGEVTQKQVSQAVDVAPPNLAVILDQMQERGLLKRVRNPHDGRSFHLVPTAKGVQLEQKARNAIAEMESQLLGQWTAAQRQSLLRLLEKLHGIG